MVSTPLCGCEKLNLNIGAFKECQIHGKRWVSVVAVALILRVLITGLRKHTKIEVEDETKHRD